MAAYELKQGLYLYPTPAGAYYAIASPAEDKPRRFLNQLLKLEQTPELTEGRLMALMETDETEKAMQLLSYCQKLGWVQGLDAPITAPQGALEDILPAMLGLIAESGKVLLADDQGFYLACSGFPHEVAEELSALSAELATVHKRRSGLLVNNLGIASHALAIVDPFGNSQIGFWPMFVGKHRFVLAISGVPHFNHAEFVSLAWALITRYLK
ncbi:MULTISPECIES: hypothetical protein [unclassified Methylomonas]|uniref:hypothetical protein n=1 Tax=unclassified Methylomonas TaxID=2608980 RepID=UPI0024785325|nr:MULTISPECIES: hypothetical protein [unclassified Methylomonas]MDT4331718.1 hypothetical protein [Methylomonas sp. MV1]WGS84144.1 hypothetical protein QC632_13895 [Methylomonas sp. UP202]